MRGDARKTLKETIKPRRIYDKKTGKFIAYRVELKAPCYFILSHPLSRFRRFESYWIGYDEAKYCAKLGTIPAFMVNLNKFTILKLWGEMAKKLFLPPAEPIPEEGYTYWKLAPESSRGSGRFPELSSMNFVLKQNADIKIYDGNASNNLEDYFTYGFWTFPKRGFCDSTIIINDEKQVHTVIKASKSIYIPIERYTQPMDLGREKQVPIGMLTLLGLTKEESRFRLQKIENVALQKDIARSLEDEKRSGHFFINGIVSEFRKRSFKFPTLMEVALYERSNFELFMSIIGVVVSQRFENGDALSRVGKIEDIEKETEHILKLLFQEAGLDKTIADSVPNLFQNALESLSPIVVTNDEDVFYMPPSVFIALFENGFIERLENKRESLVNVLKVLDMIPTTSNTQILSSKECTYLKNNGLFPERIIISLRSAIDQIHLSQIMKRDVSETSYVKEEQSLDLLLDKKESRVRHSDYETHIDVITEKEQELFRYLREEEKKVRDAKRDR